MACQKIDLKVWAYSVAQDFLLCSSGRNIQLVPFRIKVSDKQPIGNLSIRKSWLKSSPICFRSSSLLTLASNSSKYHFAVLLANSWYLLGALSPNSRIAFFSEALTLIVFPIWPFKREKWNPNRRSSTNWFHSSIASIRKWRKTAGTRDFISRSFLAIKSLMHLWYLGESGLQSSISSPTSALSALISSTISPNFSIWLSEISRSLCKFLSLWKALTM